jgi:isopenicillin-N epimerase
LSHFANSDDPSGVGCRRQHPAAVPYRALVHTFGKSMLGEWLLDPAITYLNHGTVGAPPRRVLEHQRAISDEIERQPARFMLRELADTTGKAETPSRLRVAVAAVAGFVGTEADDLVFVDNITAGANAVLRSFPFELGDEIAVTNLGYGGVTNTASYVARTSGCTLRTIEVPPPGAEPAAYVEAIVAGLGDHTRVLVVDHITAGTALVLPLAEIARRCHERGVLVLADGAHVPGNIAVDIASLGVDWYAANLHKWAWAPRSSGILWTARQHQGVLHPTVISWGLDNGIAAEFDLLGTRDPSASLTAPFAIDMMREIGLDAIYTHNHELAWWAGRYLSDRWGTAFTTPEGMIGSMVNVRLPASLGSTADDAERLRSAMEAVSIEIPIYAGADCLSLRVSAQIYNDRSDIERLGDAVARQLS